MTVVSCLRKSVAGGLVSKLSGIQSSRQERSSWGSSSTEKWVCTVFMNQWAANGEKQDDERDSQFWELSGQGGQSCFELFVVNCLRDTENRQTRENCSSLREKTKTETKYFVASVDRRWRMKLLRRFSKLAETTWSEMWVLTVKWPSGVTLRFSTVSQMLYRCTTYWAIQRSWFARVNALCNLSRKKSREVAAHFRADFWVGVASRCV